MSTANTFRSFRNSTKISSCAQRKERDRGRDHGRERTQTEQEVQTELYLMERAEKEYISQRETALVSHVKFFDRKGDGECLSLSFIIKC